MFALVRVTLCCTLVTALAVGLSYSEPKWLADLGLDFWNVPELDRAMAESQKFGERLEEKLQQTKERGARMQVLVKQLANHTLSLHEALVQVHQICDDETLRLGCECLSIPGKTEDEQVCRLLIYWTEESLREEPAQAATVHAELEAELEQSPFHVN